MEDICESINDVNDLIEFPRNMKNVEERFFFKPVFVLFEKNCQEFSII